MVNNTDKSGNKTRTTKKYKMITDTLKYGLERVIEDQAYFRQQSKSKDPRTARNGVNGLKATTIQIQRQQSAIKIDQMENLAAYNRGEIYKFW